MFEIIRKNRVGKEASAIFANYRDSVIPKFLQIIVQDGLHILVSDESKHLKPFLGGKTNISEIFYGRLSRRTIFEMTCTPNDSYYLNFKCDKVEVDINGSSAIRATKFV
jgi:hypothetical protein